MSSIFFDIFARDHASKNVSKVGQSFEGLHSKLSGFGAAAGAALAGATVAVGAMGVAAGAMGLKTASALQQAQISFETLLGSADKARTFLSDLQTFAAKTPFELPGLISAARQLLGVGASAKSVIPTLTAWGDAAGALGISQDEFSRAMLAVTQAMSKGKVQAEEMMQITEAGIPIWSLLSRATGKPIPILQDLASEGKLLAKDVFPALEKQMEKEYGGAMAKQATTLSGLWSTLMDTLNLGLARTLQPLVPFLQKYMPGATQALANALSNAGKVVKSAMLVIGPAFSTALQYVKAFWNGLKGGQAQGSGPFVTLTNAGRALAKMFQTLKPIVSQAIGVLLSLGQSFATNLLPKIQSVSGLFQTVFLPIIKQVISFVRSLIPAFQSIGASIGTFIAAIMPTLQALGKQIVAVLGPGLKQISAVINGQVVPAFATFMSAIVPIVKFIIGVFGPAIIGALKGAIQAVKGAFTIIAGLLNFFSALFKGDWGKLWEAVKQIGRGVWETIKGLFKVFLNVGLGKIFSAGGKFLTGIGRKLWTTISDLFKAGIGKAKGFVRTGIDGVVAFFKSLPGKALSAVRSLLSSFGSFIVNVMKGGAKAVTSGITGMVKLLKGLPGKIVKAVGNLSRVLFNAGKNIIKGLIDGISNMLGALRRKLSSITNMLPDWKGPARVDLKILEPAGRDVMAGFMTGIERSVPQLRRLLGTVTSGVQATGSALSLEGYKSGASVPMRSISGSTGRTAPMEVHLHFHGPVGSKKELQDWLVQSLNDLSRQGRVSPATVRR